MITEADLVKARAETKTLAEQVAYLLRTLREQAGPLRGPETPCPGLAVGSYVLGNRVYGRVTWVGAGGGVWRGQELCRVNGVVMPSMELEVVS